jgi:hypothetical protein
VPVGAGGFPDVLRTVAVKLLDWNRVMLAGLAENVVVDAASGADVTAIGDEYVTLAGIQLLSPG